MPVFNYLIIFEPIKLQILKNFVLNFTVYTEVLPVIFYLVFRKRMNDKGLRVVFFLLAITFMFDLYGLYRISEHKNNFLAYNLNLLIEATCLYIFFYHIFKNILLKRIILSTGVCFILYWVFKFIRVGGTKIYLSPCVTFENISILAFAIYYYYEQVIKINTTSIFSQPAFWVVTAYLIYIAGTFFLYLYFPSLSLYEREKYYVLNYAFVVIRTILLSIAMFMKSDDPEASTNILKVSSTLTNRSFN